MKKTGNPLFFRPFVKEKTEKQSEKLQNASTNQKDKPLIGNLPTEIAKSKRFFPVKIIDGRKIPIVSAWQNPDNQTPLDNVNGLVGFDITGHGLGDDYLVVDFDNVLKSNGDFVNFDALKWYNYLESAETYCEKSISGHGLHFFFKPTANLFKDVKFTGGNNGSIFLDEHNDKIKIEVFYRQNRYCLLTGDIYSGTSTVVDGEAADEVFQNLINAITAQNPPADTVDLPQADFPLAEAKKALFSIPCKKVDRNTWAQLGMALKDTYGDKGFDIWNQWSKTDPDRYSADACQYQWSKFCINKSIVKPVTIATLIFHAKQFGYKPPHRKQADLSDIAPELKDKIDEWQQQNGTIDPNVFMNLQAAADIVTNATINTHIANDVFIQRSLGYFKFYNFFYDIAEKFFTDLKAAKNTAKKKIADFNKDNSKPQPTDSEFAIADLNISQIKQQTESYFNQAKKQHSRYQEELKCDELNAKFAAEREAREGETTLTNVPDCPINLKIPLDTYFSERGISIIDNSGKFPKTIIATKNPLVPTKIYREPAKHLTQYEVAIKTSTGWRSILVEGQTLFDPRRIIILSASGALIEESKQLIKFFARTIAENSLPEIKCYDQTGWKNNNFDTFAYPSGSDDYVVRRAGFDFDNFFASRGDSKLLLDTFFKACDKSESIGRLFAGTALAAPLVRILGISNLQIQLNGRSGSGKTAFAKITAALFGNPKKLIATFAATQKNRIAQAAAYNDLPSFFDELETLQGKHGEDSLQEMIFNYAEGKGNQAQKRDGSARETFEFYGARLMTAERPILKSNDKRGAYKRLIQINFEELFNDDKFAAQLHFIAETNYGHFGKLWTDFIIAHQNEMLKMWHLILEHFLAYQKDFKDVEPTQLKHVAAAILAYQYFAIATDHQNEFHHGFFLQDVERIIPLLPTPAELDEGIRALNALRSFIIGHIKFFSYDIKDNSAAGFTSYNQVAWECYGKIFKDGEVTILPTALRKILEDELGFASCDEIVGNFAGKGFLRISKNKRMGYQFSTRIKGRVTMTYRFNAGVLITPEELEEYLDSEECDPVQ